MTHPQTSGSQLPARIVVVAGVFIVFAVMLWASLRAPQNPASTPSAPKEQAATRDCPACPELLSVPAGAFTMGSPAREPGRSADEGPQQRIAFAKPFLLAKYEITRSQFMYFVDAAKYSRPPNAWREPPFSQWREHPIVAVTYEDATAYAAWLTRTTGHTYRIPSEAEWEYAARAGSVTPYAWSGDEGTACAAANVIDLANHVWTKAPDVAPCNDRYPHTAPVGSYPPNAWGFHDMIGNAMEWTSDCWSDTLNNQPANGTPRLAGDCTRHALRGGSWESALPDDRLARRLSARTGNAEFTVGFRVARDE